MIVHFKCGRVLILSFAIINVMPCFQSRVFVSLFSSHAFLSFPQLSRTSYYPVSTELVVVGISRWNSDGVVFRYVPSLLNVERTRPGNVTLDISHLRQNRCVITVLKPWFSVYTHSSRSWRESDVFDEFKILTIGWVEPLSTDEHLQHSICKSNVPSC